MRRVIARRAFILQALSTIGAAAIGSSGVAGQPISACRPKVKNSESFEALVKSTPIIDIHCHIFNATDIPAYQFLQSVVSLHAFAESYLSDKDKKSIYQLKNGEWKSFYDDSKNEFDDIKELIFQHEWLDESYPIDRVLLTPGYHQEKALVEALAKSGGKYDNIEKMFIEAVLDRHQYGGGDNSRYARNWFLYSGKTWSGARKATKSEIHEVARQIQIQNRKFKVGFEALRGVKRFLACIVRTRVENFLSLRRTYEIAGIKGGSPVRFFTPALVDFDYWIAGPSAREAPASTPTLLKASGSDRPRFNVGKTTIERPRTGLKQQMELMGDLSKIFPAECHAYFPFCPWRQVDAVDAKRKTPLDMLHEAVNKHGFIGVKLYPAMGFRPRNNDLVSQGKDIKFHMFPSHLYDRKRFRYLPVHKAGQSDTDQAWRYAASKEFGTLLDKQLRNLYKYCSDNNVPVMVHAGPSNFSGGYDAVEDGELRHNFYSEKGAIEYWHKMITDPKESLTKLRLNLAHAGFGNKYWGEQLVAALKDDNQIYADVSYFEKVLGGKPESPCVAADSDGKKLFDAINKYPGLAKRFMYGSDWYMMVREDHSENYLDVVSKMVWKYFDGDGNVFKAIMAGNASRFLGLTLTENSNYTRLTAFYDRHLGRSHAMAARAKLDQLAEIGEATA